MLKEAAIILTAGLMSLACTATETPEPVTPGLTKAPVPACHRALLGSSVDICIEPGWGRMRVKTEDWPEVLGSFKHDVEGPGYATIMHVAKYGPENAFRVTDDDPYAFADAFIEAIEEFPSVTSLNKSIVYAHANGRDVYGVEMYTQIIDDSTIAYAYTYSVPTGTGTFYTLMCVTLQDIMRETGSVLFGDCPIMARSMHIDER